MKWVGPLFFSTIDIRDRKPSVEWNKDLYELVNLYENWNKVAYKLVVYISLHCGKQRANSITWRWRFSEKSTVPQMPHKIIELTMHVNLY